MKSLTIFSVTILERCCEEAKDRAIPSGYHAIELLHHKTVLDPRYAKFWAESVSSYGPVLHLSSPGRNP